MSKKRKNIFLGAFVPATTLLTVVTIVPLVSCNNKTQESEKVIIAGGNVTYDKTKSVIKKDAQSTIYLVCEDAEHKQIKEIQSVIVGDIPAATSQYHFTQGDGKLVIDKEAMVGIKIIITLVVESKEGKKTASVKYEGFKDTQYDEWDVDTSSSPTQINNYTSTKVDLKLKSVGLNPAVGNIVVKNGDTQIGSVDLACAERTDSTISITNIDWNKVTDGGEVTISYQNESLFEEYQAADKWHLKASTAGKIPTSKIIIPKFVGSTHLVGGIYDYGFENTNTEEIEFQDPEQIDYIGTHAFQGSQLVTIKIPKNVKELKRATFYNCQKIFNVTLNEGLESIGKAAFRSSHIQGLDIPNSVTSIGEEVFMDSELSTVNFKNDSKLETIGDYAFKNTRLGHITFPNSVKTIGKYVFEDCEDLQTVDFEMTLGPWIQANESHFLNLSDGGVNAFNFKNCVQSTPYNYGYTGIYREKSARTINVRFADSSVEKFYFDIIGGEGTTEEIGNYYANNIINVEIAAQTYDGSNADRLPCKVDGSWVVKCGEDKIGEYPDTLSVGLHSMEITPAQWKAIPDTATQIDIEFVKNTDVKWIKIEIDSEHGLPMSYNHLPDSASGTEAGKQGFGFEISPRTQGDFIAVDATLKQGETVIATSKDIAIAPGESSEVMFQTINWEDVTDMGTATVSFTTRTATVTLDETAFQTYGMTVSSYTQSVESVATSSNPKNRVIINTTLNGGVNLKGKIIAQDSEGNPVGESTIIITPDMFGSYKIELDITHWKFIENGEQLQIIIVADQKTVSVSIEDIDLPSGVTCQLGSQTVKEGDSIQLTLTNNNEEAKLLYFELWNKTSTIVGIKNNVYLAPKSGENPSVTTVSLNITDWIMVGYEDTISIKYNDNLSAKIANMVTLAEQTQEYTNGWTVFKTLSFTKDSIYTFVVESVNSEKVINYFDIMRSGTFQSEQIEYEKVSVDSQNSIEGKEHTYSNTELSDWTLVEEEGYISLAGPEVSSGRLIITIKATKTAQFDQSDIWRARAVDSTLPPLSK